MFKLGELRDLSIYWDTDYKPVTVVTEATKNIEETRALFLKQMDDLIPRGGESDNNLHHYILQPVSAGLKVILNKKPDAKKDPNIPKTDVMLDFKAIDMRLENKHVQAVHEIGDVFSIHQKRLKVKRI